MPEKQTIEKAQKTKRTRKVPPTKAGEFVRGKIHKNSSWRARGQIAAARTEEHGVARGHSRSHTVRFLQCHLRLCENRRHSRGLG